MIVKRLHYFLLLSILLLSCNSHTTENYDNYLNGYWEIKEVTTGDGVTKSYNYNPTIDFIEIGDSTGIRKKLQPRLDGTFITSKDQEFFTIKHKNDSLILYYQTSLDEWQENILHINENELIVKNENGNIYKYRRYEKLNIEE